MSTAIEARIEELSERIRQLQDAYYRQGRSLVPDAHFDALFDELVHLEKRHPEYRREDSPTMRVGSDLATDLPEVEHSIPVLSLDKAYTSLQVLNWVERLGRRTEGPLRVVAEPKIDGISIVLYYEKGILKRAVTRGNGYVGNDVTANVRTIGKVPLRLAEDVSIAVRGEIFLPLSQFESLNERSETAYANPRNLAAGTIRRIKSRDVASVPLSIYVYEGYSDEVVVKTHQQMLEHLAKLGFSLNEYNRPLDESSSIEQYIKELSETRQGLDYQIDGIVFKVDDLESRERLGYTGHHPRWAIAYKFEAPTALTVVKSIDVQIGRTGRATPVARVTPVSIGGSTVSNVTLHNEDYIQLLELCIGDTVSISKRGDVIPAVEEVIEKNQQGLSTWSFPTVCPSCSTVLQKIGSHHFCPNSQCPDQLYGRILHFIGKNQMDIDGLGGQTLKVLIEHSLVKDLPDIYTADYQRLVALPGFGQKKVDQILRSLNKSLERPFERVLCSLGVPELGRRASETLVEQGIDSIDKLLKAAREDDTELLTAIEGFASRKAEVILKAFRDPALIDRIEGLRKAGLHLAADRSKPENRQGIFSGQLWCVTGSFEGYKPREKAAELIIEHGGSVSSSVTTKTTHLLCGAKAGSKLAKANKLGAKVVTEEEFNLLLSR